MPPTVAVVTDSTAYLPAEAGVTIVPLQVIVDGAAHPEGTVDLSRSALSRAKTSQPPPQLFADTYARLAAAGFTAVASIHLSGELSGTAAAATAAAGTAPIPVEVVDSRSIAMGLGYPVLAAARIAQAGGDLPSVVAAARRCVTSTRTFFYVDTLDHLRRSGRIGAAASLVGSALMIKPLLEVTAGRIALLEKVRTPGRALLRLEELATKAAADLGALDVAVQHLASPERAATLTTHLTDRLPDATIRLVEVGTVVGAHVGPGMLGVTISA
ncbi:DegV family protein [Nonomuraea sp. NPDC050310]|uniref:DegV family protein n=1 Tax=unclassified Nonomuraea TaxID=2593643 RepID=UPI0033E59507